MIFYKNIFINVKNKTKDKNLDAFNLDRRKYPLKKMNIRYINFKYPTNGIRSYDNFKKEVILIIILLIVGIIKQNFLFMFRKEEG